MTTKKIHSISGVTLTVFVGFHLTNHMMSIFGADNHIEVMQSLRLFYRNIIVESALLLAVVVQIITGIKLFRTFRKHATTAFEKLHMYSGLYLAIFLMIHVSAVLGARIFLQLDTNFYFGVAGLNTFPVNLFFIPYYALAIISFFGHIADIHYKKMSKYVVGVSPKNQSIAILIIGCILTFVIFYGLTNHFKGVEIPSEYNVLVGK